LSLWTWQEEKSPTIWRETVEEGRKKRGKKRRHIYALPSKKISSIRTKGRKTRREKKGEGEHFSSFSFFPEPCRRRREKIGRVAPMLKESRRDKKKGKVFLFFSIPIKGEREKERDVNVVPLSTEQRPPKKRKFVYTSLPTAPKKEEEGPIWGTEKKISRNQKEKSGEINHLHPGGDVKMKREGFVLPQSSMFSPLKKRGRAALRLIPQHLHQLWNIRFMRGMILAGSSSTREKGKGGRCGAVPAAGRSRKEVPSYYPSSTTEGKKGGGGDLPGQVADICRTRPSWGKGSKTNLHSFVRMGAYKRGGPRHSSPS